MNEESNSKQNKLKVVDTKSLFGNFRELNDDGIRNARVM